MSLGIPRSIRAHDHSYCSQGKTPLPSICAIEKGVKIIEEILRKKMLCRHDVQDINQAYRAIDLLERQVDKVPERNTEYVLKQIIEKIKKMSCNAINIDDLISLYHLQNFLDKDLHINEYFKHFYRGFEKKPEMIQDLAQQLPYCCSEDQFDQDVTNLVGPNKSDEVIKVLNQKKAKLQSHERKQQEILRKKSELVERRKSQAETYPAYFDELLDNGYIHLYDYLIEMRDLKNQKYALRAAIDKRTFSFISHVILEAREAIIQKIENSIPAGRQNVLFLLGNTRASEFTVSFCFLRGDQMVLKKGFYEWLSDRSLLIGDKEADSCTFLPNTEVTDDWVIVDFPFRGPVCLDFECVDSRLISLGVALAFQALIKKYQLKVTTLEGLTNIDGEFAVAANSQIFLDPEDEKRLQERFEDSLFHIKTIDFSSLFNAIETIDFSINSAKFPAFEESVFESSFINTVFSQSNPEIGQFFHLPEMDRYIVRKYDKKIVKICIRKYKKFVVKDLNISLINKILEKANGNASGDKVRALRERLNELRDIMRSGGVVLTDDPELTRIQWEGIQSKNPAIVEDDCLRPLNQIMYMMTSRIKSYSFNAMIDLASKQTNPKKIAFESIMKAIFDDLTEMKKLLLRLTHIEKIIENRDAITKALKSTVIASRSIEVLQSTIQEKINKIRDVYGPEDWDQRVTSLNEEFDSYFYWLSCISQRKMHISFILAFVKKFMEPCDEQNHLVSSSHGEKKQEQIDFNKLEHVLICVEHLIEGDYEPYVLEGSIVFKDDTNEMPEIKISTSYAYHLQSFIDVGARLFKKICFESKDGLNARLILTMLAAATFKRF